MIKFFEVTAIVMSLVICYIYFGYPLLLLFLRYILPEKKLNKKEIFPEVSLLISCFNEEDVIREKLENALSIDYPKDKLEIVVISDASTDRTDDIVQMHAGKGVRLIRQAGRLGKTSGLNLAIPQTKGEIIVFSDANAMYQPDAIIKLVRNFNDKKIGYVVGEARYKDVEQSPAAKSESTYWKLEIMLKKMESRIHSVVGGDGAIYAIRRELYEELLESDINDFVNPLQIILKGYRGVYEPEAICWEETAGKFEKEYQRKIRIINRSFSGLLRVSSVMNPFKTGFFSIEIVSHKFLRWFASFFIILLSISCFILALSGIVFYQWITAFIVLFLWLSYLGHLLDENYHLKLFYYPYYFVLMGIASIVGLSRSLRGKIQTTWLPVRTVLEESRTDGGLAKVLVHACFLISLWFFLFFTGRTFNVPLLADKVTYIGAVFIIFYVYLGYPIVLKFLSRNFNEPIQGEEILPHVKLLICAYNEEEVIEKKIINSLEIDYPYERLKIAIASDGSTDRTNEIVRRYCSDRLALFEYPERRGKVSAINETVSKLQTEIIVFSDANTMYNKDAIRKLVRHFNDPSVGSVSADVILRNEETIFGSSESLYYRYERWIQKKESEVGSIIGADGGMYAIRRSLFVPPSPNIIIDDFVISMNVAVNGYRIVYDQEAIGYERNTNSYKEEFLRKSRVIAGAIQSIIQKEGVPSIKQKKLFFCYLSHKFLRWMIPIVLIVLLVANLRLVIFSEGLVYDVSLYLQSLFYILALMHLFLINIIKKSNIKLFSIPFYFCLVNSAALYGIYKGLFNKQSVKWQKFQR
jgi:cellulose synthase/poly-beta-1,6-N-acetylglucosamine synthase-like glycosyltransferase